MKIRLSKKNTRPKSTATRIIFFYTEIKKLIESLPDLVLPCAFVNIDKKTKRSVASEIVLYKLLSHEYLLKLPFVNDANSLNRELLYIIWFGRS
jgi:hypothetical protein